MTNGFPSDPCPGSSAASADPNGSRSNKKSLSKFASPMEITLLETIHQRKPQIMFYMNYLYNNFDFDTFIQVNNKLDLNELEDMTEIELDYLIAIYNIVESIKSPSS